MNSKSKGGEQKQYQSFQQPSRNKSTNYLNPTESVEKDFVEENKHNLSNLGASNEQSRTKKIKSKEKR